MKTDPTDTGGLFTGRRPGTRPVKYRDTPGARQRRRRAFDRLLAAALLALMIFINLLFWGPLPVAWLWVGSQVDDGPAAPSWASPSRSSGCCSRLLLGLVVSRRIDLPGSSPAGPPGYDQREGTIGACSP